MQFNTTIIFTEIKNGHATGNTFKNTAGAYIAAVAEKDCEGKLSVGVEPIFDANGEIEGVTDNKFYDLPVEQQLEAAIRLNGDIYASRTTYNVAE